MAQFVHLFDQSEANSIRRGGIRIGGGKWRHSGGVFVFPLTENFTVSHQWMRELRRLRGQSLLAARVRLPDGEPVLLGRFNRHHRSMRASEAIGIVRAHEDPMGWEVIVPRAIRPGEIEAFYRPPKVVGWRYSPAAKGRAPCGCPYCQRGEPFSRRLRKDCEQDR